MATFGEAPGGTLRLGKFRRVAPTDTGILSVSAGQLDAVLKEAENVTLKTRNLLADRTETDLMTSIESDSWSVAQCLDHLARTTAAFVPAFSSAITRAPLLSTNRALAIGALTRFLIQSLEPPYRYRLKVPASLVPHQRDFNAAWSAFQESQAEFAKAVRSAVGLAVDFVRIESTVHTRFSHNVYGAFRLLTAHQRRHLWQIEQILRALDGRKSSLLS